MIGVGLHGFDGHQVHKHLVDHPFAGLVAVSGVKNSREDLPKDLMDAQVRIHPTLDDLLDDKDVYLVSLCSPRRDEQAAVTL